MYTFMDQAWWKNKADPKSSLCIYTRTMHRVPWYHVEMHSQETPCEWMFDQHPEYLRTWPSIPQGHEDIELQVDSIYPQCQLK